MSDSDDPTPPMDDSLPDALTGPVERPYTCTGCGYETTHEVAPLRARVGSTCVNCGDWTIQTADDEALVDAAEAAADALAGHVLTERQALAYLLRDLVGLSRRSTAEVMAGSASNVDNLQRTARQKLADARRVVDGVDALVGDDDVPEVAVGADV